MLGFLARVLPAEAQPAIGVSATTSLPSGSITATLTDYFGTFPDKLVLAAGDSRPTSYLQGISVDSLPGTTSKSWTVTMPGTPGKRPNRSIIPVMRHALWLGVLLGSIVGLAQAPAPRDAAKISVLRPARVFDGDTLHEGWAVRVKGDRIDAVGPAATVGAPGATIIDLPATTLLPGLIEGHAHILLHPYDETTWNDQVLKESLGVRIARATNHLRATLQAGFTTVRDLGTEGAGYADVELKQAVDQGIIPGPRMIVSTRAIVATGSYGPKGFALQWRVPQGAEEADGIDDLTRVVRDQIGHGADVIKVYGDYRWGPRGEAEPTFSLDGA